MVFNKRKVFLFGIISTILLIPSLAYLLLVSGKTQFKSLKVVGPYKIVKSDTLYTKVSDFLFNDFEGKQLSTNSIKDRFYLFGFYNDDCLANMHDGLSALYDLQRTFPALWQLKVIYFNMSTKPLDLRSLTAINKAYLIKTDRVKWINIQAQDSAFIKQNFYYDQNLGFPRDCDSLLNRMVLVNWKWQVMGIYNSEDVRSVGKLKDEIKILSLEYKKRNQ